MKIRARKQDKLSNSNAVLYILKERKRKWDFLGFIILTKSKHTCISSVLAATEFEFQTISFLFVHQATGH